MHLHHPYSSRSPVRPRILNLNLNLNLHLELNTSVVRPTVHMHVDPSSLSHISPFKTTLQIISQNAVHGDKVCFHRQQHEESNSNGGFSVSLGYAVVTVPLWLPATDSLSSSENDTDMIIMTGRTFDGQMDLLQEYSPGHGPILLSVITIFSCLQYLCGDHDCDCTYSVRRGLTTGAVKLFLMSYDNPKGNGKEHIMVDGAFVIKHDSKRRQTVSIGMC